MVRVYVDGVPDVVNAYWLTSIGGGGVYREMQRRACRDGLGIGPAFKGLCPGDLSISSSSISSSSISITCHVTQSFATNYSKPEEQSKTLERATVISDL